MTYELYLTFLLTTSLILGVGGAVTAVEMRDRLRKIGFTVVSVVGFGAAFYLLAQLLADVIA